MKKIMYGVFGLSLLLASCKKEKELASESNGRTIFGTEEKPLVIGATVDTLIGDITVNTTVTRTTVLKGIVYVRPGVTLTVNPGVVIIGSAGPVLPDLVNLANNKGTLVVERGARLNANGTPAQPIVWTSSFAPGARSFGDWGGIVLLGNAPICATPAAAVACQATNVFEAFNVAGFPNPTRNEYGGNNAADNSGTLRYNRIEFCGGTVAAADREVNGLTLCGVGSGTLIDYVQVNNSGDDAFEWFGGTVNAKHLIAYANKDDDFDFDEGYRGKLQFIVSYKTTLSDNSSSHFIENDGNPLAIAPGANQRTQPQIFNASFTNEIGGAVTGGGFFDTAAILTRRRASLIFANGIVKVLPVRRHTRTFAFTNVGGGTTSSSLIAQGTLGFPGDSVYVGVNIIDQGSSPFLAVSSTNENGRVGLAPLALPLQGNTSTVIGPYPSGADFLVDRPGGFNPAVLGFFSATTTIGSNFSTWVPGSGWISTATN
jgi:hypothetical protein